MLLLLQSDSVCIDKIDTLCENYNVLYCISLLLARPPNVPLFCSLASVVVVCNAASAWAVGRRQAGRVGCRTADTVRYGCVPLGRHLVSVASTNRVRPMYTSGIENWQHWSMLEHWRRQIADLLLYLSFTVILPKN